MNKLKAFPFLSHIVNKIVQIPIFDSLLFYTPYRDKIKKRNCAKKKNNGNTQANETGAIQASKDYKKMFSLPFTSTAPPWF